MRMNRNTIITAVVALLIGLGVGYYAPHGASPAGDQSGGGQFVAGQNGGRMGMRTGQNGGFTAGQVLSKDASSITLKMQDGSTKIVLFSPQTEVLETASTTIDSVSVGTNVVVTGSQNSDGSITATAVQIRPQGASRGSGFGG